MQKTASPDYEFGDLSKAAAQQVVEWGKKVRGFTKKMSSEKQMKGRAWREGSCAQ